MHQPHVVLGARGQNAAGADEVDQHRQSPGADAAVAGFEHEVGTANEVVAGTRAQNALADLDARLLAGDGVAGQDLLHLDRGFGAQEDAAGGGYPHVAGNAQVDVLDQVDAGDDDAVACSLGAQVPHHRGDADPGLHFRQREPGRAASSAERDAIGRDRFHFVIGLALGGVGRGADELDEVASHDGRGELGAHRARDGARRRIDVDRDLQR